MNKLIEFLKKCSDCYYNSFSYYLPKLEEVEMVESELGITIPLKEVDDETYDKVYFKTKSKYPFDSFFGDVGASVANEYGKDIKFDRPMGSMNELKAGDWDKWKLNNYYIVSEKLDGLSVILFYEDGKLVRAASRGDGYVGKDITRHIMYITNIPKVLNDNVTIEVRGELICPKDDIQHMINDLRIETGKEYKNGRNTISGFLNSKETLKSVAKYAKFNAFDCSGEFKCELDRFNKMSSLGFEVVKYWKFPGHLLSEKFLIETTTSIKTDSSYECDGIILTLNEVPENYQGFETGTINPKKSRKFKISNIKNDAETVVTGITWQVSKSGKLIPVIQIEPVVLCGATITNVTGHNYKNMVDNLIGIGARIKVVRSGDVIPYVKEVLCPSACSLNLPKIETVIDGVDIRIKDLDKVNEYTDEMKIQQMLYFAKTLEIDCLGYGNLKELYNVGYKTIFDVLKLDKVVLEHVLGLNGIKIFESLHKDYSEVELMSALNAFGEGISTNILQNVFNKYYTLNVTEAQLKMLNGFGEVRIKQYLDNIPNYLDTLNKLKWCNITIKSSEHRILSDKFASYVVCFTGVRDTELSKKINENGGIANDSWNKNVNLLVAKDPNGTSGKISKAREKGIKVVSLEEARKIFE